MPQATNKREPDELDLLLDKLGASDDPRDRDAVRRMYKEEAAPAVETPTVFRRPGTEDTEGSPEQGRKRAGVAEDVLKQLFSTGLDVAAAAPGGGTSMAASVAIPALMRMIFPNQKPPEYMSPENAASGASLLTNLATKASPLGKATKYGPLVLKGLLEGAVPGAAYVGESAREGDTLTGPSKAFAVGLPGLLGALGGVHATNTYRRATQGPAAMAARAPGQVTSGEITGAPLPDIDVARADLEALQKRAGIGAGALTDLEQLPGNLPPSQNADLVRQNASRSAQLASDRLRDAQQARSLLKASLTDVGRDLSLISVREKQIQRNIGALLKNPDIGDLAKNKQINALREEMGQLPDRKESLLMRQAELRKNIDASESQIAQFEELARSTETTSQVALKQWDTVKTSEVARKNIVNDFDKRTGWKFGQLNPDDKELIRRLAKEAPNEMVDKTIGQAMSGAVEKAQEHAYNWAKTLFDPNSKILNEEERNAMRTLVARRIVAESRDPATGTMRQFLRTKGGETGFTHSGLSKIGEDAINTIFDSPSAYTNLTKLADDLNTANKPGLRLIALGGGSVAGGMAMFFWGARFAQQHEALGAAGIGTGVIIAGKIGWDKFVDYVVSRAHKDTDASQALFKAMENRMLLPAKGVASSTAGQAIAEPAVRAKNRRRADIPQQP